MAPPPSPTATDAPSTGGPGPAGVLRSRLLPPRLPPGCLVRLALVERVLDGLSGPIVAVLAGAGYGKSTLLAQAHERSERVWVWCSCDDRLGTTALLMAHLAAGLADRFPGFGARLSLDGSAEQQVSALCNEIVDTLSDDFVIALDDIHTLTDRPASEALGLLVRDLPPMAHLVLAGRSPLPFPLGRLRVARLLEVGEADLALNVDEAAELLAGAELHLDAATTAVLHRATEGWVAGLILAAQTGGFGARGKFAEGHLFDYLAEEVLARQPAERQAFLLETSVLDRFTPELADVVTGRAGSAETARALVREHLFTIRLDAGGEWYRYHHLFQAFLRRRLEEREPQRVAPLHRRAGDAWKRSGEPVEAVRHYIEAGEPAAAVDALEPLAEAMVSGPGAATVAGWLDVLPRDVWAGRPALVLAEGTLLFGQGEREKAFATLERGIEQLLVSGEHDRAAMAFFRLLFAHIGHGAPVTQSIEIGERYLPRFDPSTRILPAAHVIMAARYGFLGRHADVDAQLDRACALPAASAFPALDAYAVVTRAFFIDHAVGRIADGLARLDEALAYLVEHPDDDPLAYIVMARSWRGVILNQLGWFEETLAESARFREAAERRAMRGILLRGDWWLRSVAFAELGRWDDLDDELRSEASVSAQRPGTAFAYRYHTMAARLAAVRGQAADVRRHAETAREEVRKYGAAFDQAGIFADLALAAWEAGLGALARELVDETMTRPPTAARPHRARAALLGAVVHGTGTRGDELLALALELTDRSGYEGLWLRRERRFAGPLLGRAIAKRLGPPGLAAQLATAAGGEVFTQCLDALERAPASARLEIAERLSNAPDVTSEVVDRLLADRDRGVQAAARSALPALAARPRPALRLISMGGFAVRRGQLSIPIHAFGRERGRALLAALLCAGRPLHREEILEWFWPVLPPERGLRAFHVTLYELRRALEPDLARGAASSVIVADGEAYRLQLAPQDTWDAAEFLALAARALAETEPTTRARLLEGAEAGYGGVLFPEWPYAPWAETRRAEVERMHRAVLTALAEDLVAAGRSQEAITRYGRLVELEPEREAWHRALMGLFAATGERALALRQFHACRALLRRELGIEPSAETRELYRQLLGP